MFDIWYNIFKQPCCRVVASQTRDRWEVVLMMTTFEAISLMLAFGMLLITLLAYIDRENKRKK